jgi:hypothetical protein
MKLSILVGTTNYFFYFRLSFLKSIPSKLSVSEFTFSDSSTTSSFPITRSSGRSLRLDEVEEISRTEAVLPPLELFSDVLESVEVRRSRCICFGNRRDFFASMKKKSGQY